MSSSFDVPEPENEQELRARVERGDARYCIQGDHAEGLPFLAGYCITCYLDELQQGMPPMNSRDELERDMQRAFGVDRLPYRELLSRDASEWDNRKYRGWSGFRCQILFVPYLSPLALPGRWILRAEALPPGVQSTRLVLEPAPSDTADTAPITQRPNRRQGRKPSELKTSPDAHRSDHVVVFRVRLWRLNSPGYLQGVWLGDQDRLEWTLHDIGEISPAGLEKMWLPAIREERKRGRPGGPLETRDELIAAIRDVYMRARDAKDVRLERIPKTELRATIAQRIQLPKWYSKMSDSTLRDHLRYYELKLSEILPELYGRARR